MKRIFLLTLILLLLPACTAEIVLGETTTETETQAQAETTQSEPIEEKWAVLTPPLDYEVMYGFAKTPTHYFAEHEGGIVYAPIDNLAKQTKIPLPDKHEGMKLSGAEICGITKGWLFVTIRKYRKEEEPSTFVTFRIAMESWEAEVLAESASMPWYNAASDSLLIPDETLEAMPLSTRKRTRIAWENAPEAFPMGRGWEWWDNTVDGHAVLVECYGASAEDCNYFVFDKQNQVQLKAYHEVQLAKRWCVEEAPKNKVEENLRAEGIWAYVTCGEYVYYKQQDNFYRVKTDGTQRKLLREKTNIFDLYSVGGKLFCEADNPAYKPENEWDGGQIDIYLLNEEGKHAKTLFTYREDTEGNSGYGLIDFGGKLMVIYSSIYGPLRFEFLYDPAMGARFPAQTE